MKLVPVQGDPFAGGGGSGPTLKPVQGDPFAPKEDSRPIEDTWLSTIDDWASSIGSGVTRAAEGTVGLLGDVERGVDWAGDQATELLLGPPKNPDTGQVKHIAPTTEQVAGVVDPLLPSGLKSSYQPKSTYTKYLQTISEFATGALTGDAGAVSAALKRVPGATPALIKSLIKWGVIPGATSEAAGQLADEITPGSPLADAARIAGGLLGTRVSTAAFNKTAQVAAKSIHELTNLAKMKLDEAHNAGVLIKPQSIEQLGLDMAGKLRNQQIDRTNHKNAFKVASDILDEAIPPRPGLTKPRGLLQPSLSFGTKSLEDLEAWRQRAREVTRSPDFRNHPHGMAMIDAIDNFMDDMIANPTKHLVSGDPRGVQALKDYRKYYHLKKRGEEIEDMLARARLRAGVVYSHATFETALAHEAKNMINRKNFKKVWSPDEQKAFHALADEKPATEKLFKLLGKTALRGIIGFLTGVELSKAHGWGATMGLWGTGQTARWLSNRAARKAGEDLSTMVRGGSPSRRLPIPLPAQTGVLGGIGGIRAPLGQQPPASPLAGNPQPFNWAPESILGARG